MQLIVIVLDGVGIGNAPDAALFGDEGSNTLVNTANAVGGLHIPNLQALGLGNLDKIEGVAPITPPVGSFGRLRELSNGKGSTVGHWELMGIITKRPFPTYPNGFPPDVIDEFKERIGRGILGNIPASGTVIIEQLGKEHIRTGYPIVYTSADSVFQIAAHKDIVPLETLYEWCRIARKILTGDNAVARVIARPFVGEPGNFTRTAERKDFSLPPPRDTVLDIAKSSGFDVVGIGKIEDLFAFRGLTESYHTHRNPEGIEKIIEIAGEHRNGIIFANLIDFDQLYGHRNDPSGMAEALEEFDRYLPDIMATIKENDYLFITADHGNDPTTPSTDHSREEVPLLVFSRGKKGKALGTHHFCDLGATIADILGIDSTGCGESLLALISG